MAFIRLKTTLLATLVSVASHCNAQSGTPNNYTLTVDFVPNGRTITHTAFSSGFDFMNPLMPQFAAAPTSPSGVALKTVNPGTIRYPHGTRADHYLWNDIQNSFCDAPVAGSPPNDCMVSRNQWLSVDQIYQNFAANTLQGTAKKELLLQVNAWFASWNGDSVICQEARVNPRVSPCTIKSTALDEVAANAAAWVAYDRSTSSTHAPTVYWEIGNESWIQFTPEQYAKIFAKIGTAMIGAAGGTPIKLLAQAQVGNMANNYPVFSTVSNAATVGGHTGWIARFAAQLQIEGFPLNQVHGLSIHTYPGSTSTSITPNTQEIVQQIAKLDLTGQPHGLAEAMTAANARNWKVWVTEFQVDNSQTVRNAIGIQNKANAVVLADMVGKLQGMGVERVFLHQLANDVQWAPFQYWHAPSTGINDPIMMPGGLVMSKYASHFGLTNGSATSSSNFRMPKLPETYSYGSNTNLGYSPVGAYTSHDPVAKKLKLMLVNRDLVNSTKVKLVSLSKKITATYSSFNWWADVAEDYLTSASGLATSNAITPQSVRWDAKPARQVIRSCPLVDCAQNSTFDDLVTLPPGGVSFITMATD